MSAGKTRVRTPSGKQGKARGGRAARGQATPSRTAERALFDLHFQLVAILSVDGRLLDVNDVALRTYGVARNQAVGAWIWETEWWRDVRNAASWWQALLRDAAQSEVPIRRTSSFRGHGEWRDAELVLTSLPSAEGGADRVLVQAVDTTHRNRRSEALRLSEERFRLLSRATNDAVWDLDLATGHRWWNEGFEALFGYRREEVEPTAESWTRRIHPEDAVRVVRGFYAAIENGKSTWTDEYRFRRSNGTYAHVLDRGYVLRGKRGAAVRAIGGMMDVSDSRRADAALRESEQRLRSIIDASPAPHLLADARGTTTFVNRAFRETFGYGSDDVPSLDAFWRVTCPEDAYRAYVTGQYGAIRRLSGADTRRHPLEAHLRAQDGHERTVLISAGEPGQERGELMVFHDITDRKLAELRISATNRALQLLYACNEAVVRATAEASLLEEVCEIAVARGGYRTARVVFTAAEDEGTFEVQACAGPPPPDFVFPRADPHADPRLVALSEGRPNLVADLSDDPRFAPARDEIRAAGLGAAVWLPLRAGDERFGLLAVFSGAGASIDDDDVLVLKQLASDLSFGLARLRQGARRAEAEAALTASLAEKEALLKEVHHRVKNNMQVIASLIRLESNRVEHATTRAVLAEMQGRIQAMALLHESLYRTRSFARVDLGGYVRQIVNQIARSVTSPLRDLRFEFDLATVEVDFDRAIPCGLIVNELVSNAVKHAFVDRDRGEVSIGLRSAGEEIHLRVADDGRGLPPDFDERRQKSLGVQLVSDLARQLGGTVSTLRAAGVGVEVRFPTSAMRRHSSDEFKRPNTPRAP